MTDLRKTRPVRFRLGQAVYWAIWGPAFSVAAVFLIPFLGLQWLVENAIPTFVGAVRPAWAAAHDLALKAGNAVIGYKPSEED